MAQLLEILWWIFWCPGFMLGLMLGGAGPYFLGVRDPFFLALGAVIGALAGLFLDIGRSPRRQRPRRRAR